ncbi:nuclear transport factor 2 family protein [uncultured Croceitalea sp.]|uniref:nuclear transport factor 2 family protein n=1 Tax=uncultured Croceitalea sp. TaxID=1798908 RepID=UPI0033059F8C
MNEANQAWEIYRASWSNENSGKRAEELQKITTDDFKYRDPNIELSGFEQLSDYMSEFQKEFTGSSFVIRDFIVHHNRSLSNWNMVNCENEVIAKGTDFATYENGKLKQITGFFKEG